MFLAPHKISEVAREMVQSLLKEEHIETNLPREVQLDLEAVLNQYSRTEQDLLMKARATLDARGLSPRDLPRVLKGLADQRKVKVGEEALDYVLEQLVEMLLNSSNVEEVFAEDHDLRRQLREPLRKRAQDEVKVDKKVRSQLKHVKEGGALWEVEYQRMLEDIRRRKGI